MFDNANIVPGGEAKIKPFRKQGVIVASTHARDDSADLFDHRPFIEKKISRKSAEFSETNYSILLSTTRGATNPAILADNDLSHLRAFIQDFLHSGCRNVGETAQLAQAEIWC
jgi:hypothetical protein